MERDEKRASTQLAPLQEAMWVADRLAGTPEVHNIGLRIGVQRSRIDPVLLQAAVDAISARHEMLRTSCHVGDDFKLSLQDNGHGPRLRTACDVRTVVPVSFEDKPAWSVSLDSDTHTTVLLVFHHALVDPWSMRLVVSELQEAYESLEAGRAYQGNPLSGHYRDFIRLTRHQASLPSEESLDHWRDRISLLEPPSEALRHILRGSAAYGGRLVYDLSHLEPIVTAAANGAGASRFSALLTVCGAAVQRQFSLSAVTVQVPLLNRSLPESHHTVGCYSDLVPVVINTDDRPWRNQIRSTFREIATAIDLQLPSQAILDHYTPERREVLLALKLCTVTLYPKVSRLSGDWRIDGVPIPAVSHAFHFAFEESDSGLRLILRYSKSAGHQHAKNLARSLISLLQEAR